MKRTCIYIVAFVLGLLSINIGFYLMPVYQLLPNHIVLGPLFVFLVYFILGLPPVVVYFRVILKDNWLRSLFKGTVIILINVLLLGSFAFIMMRKF